MNTQINNYINKYPIDVVNMFNELKQLIFESISHEIEEKLWANMPSYYVGESFVRLIPFKNHINIEAKGVILHMNELADYKITTKGMLQIYVKEDIPYDILRNIFAETLV